MNLSKPEQTSIYRRSGRPIWRTLFATVIVLACAGVLDAFAGATVAAAERPLSDAQLRKIEAWVAARGADAGLSKMVTDILGLTKDNETMSARGFAEKDAESNDVHQINILPGSKGYLVFHLHQNKIEVYWADQELVLISAETGAREGKPAADVSFQEAQAGYRADGPLPALFAASGRFAPSIHREYTWTWTLDADRFGAYLRTVSPYHVLDEAPRFALFDALAGAVAAHGGTVDLPWETQLHVATRL